MSYQARQSRLLLALLLSGICGAATTSATDAHGQQAVTIDTSQLRSRYKLLSIVNRSSWSPDLPAIENIIYETLIRRDPASIGAADVRIEETGNSRTKDLVVRTFAKNSNDFATHVITVDKDDVRRKPLDFVRKLYSRCDEACVKKLIEQAVCPDEGNPDPTHAVFATPSLGFDNSDDDPSFKAITKAASDAQAARKLNVKLLSGRDATPQRYIDWLVCPSVRFFGSIAKKNPDTGDIALANGELPANWFNGFANTPLHGKIIFFNSGPAYNAGMLASARDIAKVRTFIAVNENFTNKNFSEEKAADVFTCFWQRSLTSQYVDNLHLKVWGAMGSLLRTCENDRWGERDVFSIVGDDGPIWHPGGFSFPDLGSWPQKE